MLPVEIVVCACSVRDKKRKRKHNAERQPTKLHALKDNLAPHNDLRPTKPLTDNIGHFPFNMFVPPLRNKNKNETQSLWIESLPRQRCLQADAGLDRPISHG